MNPDSCSALAWNGPSQAQIRQTSVDMHTSSEQGCLWMQISTGRRKVPFLSMGGGSKEPSPRKCHLYNNILFPSAHQALCCKKAPAAIMFHSLLPTKHCAARYDMSGLGYRLQRAPAGETQVLLPRKDAQGYLLFHATVAYKDSNPREAGPYYKAVGKK
eukprot:1139173-Pelagomonas_calceolata.AAC.5